VSHDIDDVDVHEFTRSFTNEDGGNEQQTKTCGSKFCNFYSTHQLAFVITGAVAGICLGVGLSFWQPEDTTAKDTAILWIGLLGDLFIRALKCVILPLVFCSITISVMDMLCLGKAGTMVAVTIGLYIFTTICAVTFAIIGSLIYSDQYAVADDTSGDTSIPEVTLACSVDSAGNPTSFLTEMNDGSVMCAAGEPTDESLFLMDDVNGYFATTSEGGPAKMTLSESLYKGLFMQMIGPNMVGLFVDNNFLGVIVLGTAFGIALTSLGNNPPKGVKWTQILIVQLLEELMHIFMMFVNWIIFVAPICILSLVASAIGKQSDMTIVLETLSWLMASFFTAAAMQVVFCYMGLYFAFLRQNPLKYYASLIEALVLAFTTSSSAATLPVSMDCVVKSGKVPAGVARFVLPLGATINMDGTAIYIVCSCVALAYLNGIVPTAADYIIIGVSATLGSIGTAPVPSASIVLIITSYQTAFGGDVPYGIEFIFAIDWLIDRFRTMFNVCGDTVVAALVASRLDEESTDEFLKKVEKVEEDIGGDYDEKAPQDEKHFDMHGHKNSVTSA
jgi:Na+/H+-dicarboxylate symporter